MPRSKEFDPDVVLDRATDLFWKKGYEATSIKDLVSHMRINRFSLYSTFVVEERHGFLVGNRCALLGFDVLLAQLVLRTHQRSFPSPWVMTPSVEFSTGTTP